jgi:excisionase family DNA binding protein
MLPLIALRGRRRVKMKVNGVKKAQIMTLREVAQYLGLHVMTVYKLTREGRVPAAKIGGQWRFKRDVLDGWLETQMNQHV